MSFHRIARRGAGAALAVAAFLPGADHALAGTAVAAFEVSARLAGTGTPACRGAGDPVFLACWSDATVTLLQLRPLRSGSLLLDGWVAGDEVRDAHDRIYMATITTRRVRYQQWEYVETLVSW